MTSPLHVTSVATLRCGAGFRDFCFVKISTDGVTVEGKPLVGWSEYLEERNIGVTQVIEWLGSLVVGQDPRPYARIMATLQAHTRHVIGGLAQQGLAAIENALLDVVGKAFNVPVCALFGGPVRTELPVYWSHCGSFRVGYHEHLYSPFTKRPVPPLRSLDDVEALCAEVKRSGHTALKTNIFLFDASRPSARGRMYMPGFGGGAGSPELNASPDLIDSIVRQMRTFRRACGDKIGIKLDLNYNFRTEGFIQVAKALNSAALGGRGLDWLELDTYSPAALRQIRDAAPMPIASLESLMGRRSILPFLEAGAVDTAIIDPLWNGVDESLKMASLCDVFEVNVAAHNYHGWLGTAICAHFCACAPNFKVLEVDVDDVPWKDEIVTVVPSIADGVFSLPVGPGWGVDVDEDALKRHPPLNDARSGIWSAAAPVGPAASSKL